MSELVNNLFATGLCIGIIGCGVACEPVGEMNKKLNDINKENTNA
jgi:hypothetical protein